MRQTESGLREGPWKNGSAQEWGAAIAVPSVGVRVPHGEVGGTVFEAIPENLILRAALIAASQVLGAVSEPASS